jgi:hypothetical protein
MSTGMGLFLIVLLVFGVLVGGTTMIKDLTSDLENAQTELQSCQASEQSLHGMIGQKDAEIAQAADQYAQCKFDYDSIMITNAQCSADVEALKAAITEASAEGDGLKQENAQCKAVVKDLTDKIAGLEGVVTESGKLLLECDDKLANLSELPQSCLSAPISSLVPGAVLSDTKPVLPEILNERGIAIIAMAFLGLMSLMNLMVAYRDQNQVQPVPQTTKVNANPNKVTITMDKKTYQDFIRYMRNR